LKLPNSSKAGKIQIQGPIYSIQNILRYPRCIEKAEVKTDKEMDSYHPDYSLCLIELWYT